MTKTKTLVIVESPSKGKTIGKYLGAEYIVAASGGHVRDLPPIKLGVDTANGFAVTYQVVAGKEKFLDPLKAAAKKAKKVILATDPDREGEAIAWHLAEILKVNPGRPCRAEFHEITANGIKKAIDALRPVNMERVEAQKARRVIDRLVGYKVTGLLKNKMGGGKVTAGRVQSVALRLLVDRQLERSEFTPKEYWTITGTFMTVAGATFTAKLVTAKPLPSAEIANNALDYIRAQTYTVASVERKEARKSPPPPFTTSTLQQAAVQRLMLRSGETMSVAQQLYEGVEVGSGVTGLITYMRTDSVRISEEFQQATRKHIRDIGLGEYLPKAAPVYKNKGGNVQDAHEAIRPVRLDLPPEAVKPYLDPRQHALYKMIYERYLASQLAPVVFDATTAFIIGDKAKFKATGRMVTFPGFTVLWNEATAKSDADDDEEPGGLLPKLAPNDPVILDKADGAQKFTKPSAAFTEATLIKALEEHGVGRPSTYAPTLETIQARGYVARQESHFLVTDLGLAVDKVLRTYFPTVIDVKYTAQMEESLDFIEEGTHTYVGVVGGLYGHLSAALTAADTLLTREDAKDLLKVEGQCPECGGDLLIKKNHTTGESFIGCRNYPACRHVQADSSKTISTPCPSCGGQLVTKSARQGKRGKFYACSRYPECKFTAPSLAAIKAVKSCQLCGTMMVPKKGPYGDYLHCPACKRNLPLGKRKRSRATQNPPLIAQS